MNPPTPTSAARDRGFAAVRQLDAATGANGDNYGPYGKAQRYNNPSGGRSDNYQNYNSTNSYPH